MATRAETNSVLVRTSRYTAGGQTEVNTNALEWWERTVYTVNDDDRAYVVEAKFENRLDLISAVFFGEPRHWWVIAQYNNILDPSSEVKSGTIIYIPTVARLNEMINGTIGGVPSTREVPTSILPIV